MRKRSSTLRAVRANATAISAAAGAGLLMVASVSVPVVAKAEVLEGVGTVVAVVDPATTPGFPAASLMRADCAVVARVWAEDDSATEWMACELSAEPVMIPENQGVPPESTITYGGGSCTWISDFMATSQGVEVYADDFEVTVTPSGRVFVWATYAAEPTLCAPAEMPSPPAEPDASPGASASPTGSTTPPGSASPNASASPGGSPFPEGSPAP